MSRKYEVRGRTAVITGAAGAIGRAIAVSLAKRGCDLALADRNDMGLQGTKQMVREGVRVSTHHLDVSDRDAIMSFPEEVLRVHPGVDILVNNAGVAIGGTFEQASEEDFDWLMSINFFGVVRMTRAFLPLLHKTDDARIVNISSIFGIVAPPEQTAYCSAKFAVKGFSDSLRNELRATKIGVTVVHPGGVATRIAEDSRPPAYGMSADTYARRRALFNKLLRMPPEIAGEIIVDAIAARKDRILVGSDAKFMSLMSRLFPVNYWKALTWRGPLRDAEEALKRVTD